MLVWQVLHAADPVYAEDWPHSAVVTKKPAIRKSRRMLEAYQALLS